MGDWLEKLERKYYRYSIPNLPAILAGGQVAVLVILCCSGQTSATI